MAVDRPDFNNLTAAEAERLAVLIEELAEAQQAACKILRHGYESKDPTDPLANVNRYSLAMELAHVQAAMERMRAAGDISMAIIKEIMWIKVQTGEKWMHHQ